MRRSRFPLSQSPLTRPPNDRKPAFGTATTLTITDARASDSYASSEGQPFAPDNDTHSIAMRLKATRRSHYSVTQYMSDMPCGARPDTTGEMGLVYLNVAALVVAYRV